MKKGALIYFYCFWLLTFCCSCGDGSDSANINLSGQGGSMARFAISGNNLYVVGESSLLNYDITDPAHPSFNSEITLGFDIETIFPKGNYLFIGAQSGMHIFDVSDPENLVKLSTYSHIVNCDPVVVSGNYAYESLQAGCGSNSADQFEVIDITDPANPKQVGQYNDVDSPYGLGVVNNYIYLCEGEFGIKILNVQDPENIFLEKELAIDAYDVIVIDQDRLLLTSVDGIYQFDISDPITPQLISEIPVVE
ncbi:hypothetical protein JMN32_00730 [Fulvivirga sp. 29W222]|uniref:LVIVD repeat-containing protein n=1 Tax=Fulvivirga marina TaxID=2494733 RepID=A0A937KC33_9BACT|nr:hypothetical protein [Fulvivirga marina]MBL6444813.1 hypothetical protein [Fulvivirga marina]